MVEVARDWQVEECLEEPVDVGGGQEVLAAGHVGDFLPGVIDNHGKVVGGRDVLAGQDDVAQAGEARGDASPSELTVAHLPLHPGQSA